MVFVNWKETLNKNDCGQNPKQRTVKTENESEHKSVTAKMTGSFSA